MGFFKVIVVTSIGVFNVSVTWSAFLIHFSFRTDGISRNLNMYEYKVFKFRIVSGNVLLSMYHKK